MLSAAPDLPVGALWIARSGPVAVVAQYFEPEDKVAFLRDYCESRDLSMNEVVAIAEPTYGDLAVEG